MTAGEIRKLYQRWPVLDRISEVPTEQHIALINVLGEIAAQLAELNDKLTLFSVGNDSSYKSLAVTLFEKEEEEAG